MPVAGMGVQSDDVVVIQKAKQPGEPCVITINCPDKTGLGCDICSIILEFGLYVTKGGIVYTIVSNIDFLARIFYLAFLFWRSF